MKTYSMDQYNSFYNTSHPLEEADQETGLNHLKYVESLRDREKPTACICVRRFNLIAKNLSAYKECSICFGIGSSPIPWTEVMK